MLKRLVILWALLAAACGSPTQPDETLRQYYTCGTQPRQYVSADALLSWYEVDHYVQYSPCPATPIN